MVCEIVQRGRLRSGVPWTLWFTRELGPRTGKMGCYAVTADVGCLESKDGLKSVEPTVWGYYSKQRALQAFRRREREKHLEACISSLEEQAHE